MATLLENYCLTIAKLQGRSLLVCIAANSCLHWYKIVIVSYNQRTNNSNSTKWLTYLTDYVAHIGKCQYHIMFQELNSDTMVRQRFLLNSYTLVTHWHRFLLKSDAIVTRWHVDFYKHAVKPIYEMMKLIWNFFTKHFLCKLYPYISSSFHQSVSSLHFDPIFS